MTLVVVSDKYLGGFQYYLEVFGIFKMLIVTYDIFRKFKILAKIKIEGFVFESL